MEPMVVRAFWPLLPFVDLPPSALCAYAVLRTRVLGNEAMALAIVPEE